MALCILRLELKTGPPFCVVIRATRRSRRLHWVTGSDLHWVQREWLHFSVILRPWVLVRLRESNPRPPALQSTRSIDWTNTARSVRKIGIWILGLQGYNKLVKQGDDWWLDVCLAGRAKRGRMASLHCIQKNKFLSGILTPKRSFLKLVNRCLSVDHQ